jgi:hypothetical protein
MDKGRNPKNMVIINRKIIRIPILLISISISIDLFRVREGCSSSFGIYKTMWIACQ